MAARLLRLIYRRVSVSAPASVSGALLYRKPRRKRLFIELFNTVVVILATDYSLSVPTSLDCRSIPESELDVCWSDLVGEGHFASVHEAIRRSTQDKVVIKVLHPDKRHFEEYR